MLISFVKFLKLMKETFENNVEINFEVHINFENLDKKKEHFSLCCTAYVWASLQVQFQHIQSFFSVLRIGQGDNDCHIPVFFPCCLSFSGDLAAKSRQMSYRKSGQTVGQQHIHTRILFFEPFGIILKFILIYQQILL